MHALDIGNKSGKYTIISNIFFLLAGTGISQTFSAIALLITARSLGPQNYGQYTSSLTFATFTSIVFSLGLNTWGIYEASRNPNKLSHTLGSILTIKLVIGGLWCLGIASITFFLDWPGVPKELVILGCVVVWVDNIFATLLTPLFATLRNHLTSTIVILSDFLWLAATLWITRMGFNDPTSFLVIRLGTVFISVFCTAPWIILAFRLSPIIQSVKEAFTNLLPYAVSEFLNNSLRRADVLLVAFLLGPTATGIYAPAVSIVNVLILFFDAIGGVMLPVLGNRFKQDASKAWSLSTKYIWSQVLFGLGFIIIVELSQTLFLSFLGSRYQSTFDILHLLSVILMIHPIGSASAVILTSMGQQTRRTKMQSIGVALNIVLNIFLLTWLGVFGAAIAYIITELFLAIGYSFSVLKYRRLHPFEVNAVEETD